MRQRHRGGKDRPTRNFPSFSEGLSLRLFTGFALKQLLLEFPFLFGGTFIEAREDGSFTLMALDFPSFSEGLSLRRCDLAKASGHSFRFPFLFEGTFIEAGCLVQVWIFLGVYFPSFSEGLSLRHFGFGILGRGWHDFPSFSEGLSLRPARFRNVPSPA